MREHSPVARPMNVEEMTGRVLVDTNVLIYATLAGDSRHNPAQEVLEKRHLDGVELFISVQNLAEMYPNLTGPKNQPPDSPEFAKSKIQSISRLSGVTILPVTNETVKKALDLCEELQVTRQNYFDMQLVAAMKSEGIPTIVTENAKDFEMIKGLNVVNPFRNL